LPYQSYNNIAVVIPCYKVRDHILDVINCIGPYIDRIYVVDDCCPESSGDFVKKHCEDKRVIIISNFENQGVGGAVMTGYRAAIDDGMEIMVKLDGDGQMDPYLLPDFILPIINGEADYTKGNRFFNLDRITEMPKLRIIGNALLSLITKLSSGYWNLFDPTNGYTAIHRDIARHLPFEKISRRFFFESDMLFRLNILRAVVIDIPMDAKYGSEESNLDIHKILGEFFLKNIRNFLKRIFYNYYLRGMSLASFELPLGAAILLFGIIFGSYHWYDSWNRSELTPVGTIMISAVSLITGLQFILSFLSYDISNVPNRISRRR